MTLADVGRRIGVSGVTVSNVINHRGGTSAATQAKVWAAIEETGYVANLAARSLAGGKTNTVGVLVPDLSTQYASEIVRGISEMLAGSGLEMLVSTSYDTALERNRVDLLKKITDGLLFLLPFESQNSSQKDVRSFDFQGRPVVAIEYRSGTHAIPTVNIDDFAGTKSAVGYLVSLGHRRIGFVGGPAGRLASETRLSAYWEALAEAGLFPDAALVRPGDFTQPTGFAAAQALLELDDPPTAIFAANDLSAFGVIEAVKHQGLRIPEDVSVVGFDDIPMASQVFPALTTVKRPLEQLGGTAVTMLLATLRGEATPTDVILPTQLVVRATSGRRT